ncbi:hypothetical protein QYE76_034032 [Lolium multiflorum]|uniref:Uncharacterized protein n=1 Tax=Lolium multiflorum TaxID=4521 RepID=A0AAD8QYT1_LOLMU|nr:hypothetical protein QYE76_034032 [Lolium multiflorum]
MQLIVDALAAAGEPIHTREHISFILVGLGAPYNALVAALGAVTTPLTLPSLYAQLRAYDQRQEMLGGTAASEFETSANLTQRSGHGLYNSRSRGDYSDRGDRGDYDRCDTRREDRRDDRCDDRQSRQGRGGGRAPSGGAMAVDVEGIALRHGSTQPAKSATKRVMLPNTAGGGSRKMMTTPMTRKPMLPPMVWTQTGSRTPIFLGISVIFLGSGAISLGSDAVSPCAPIACRICATVVYRVYRRQQQQQRVRPQLRIFCAGSLPFAWCTHAHMIK